MNCSTPGFLVLQHLLELAQIHVHPVHEAIQSSLTQLSPSPPAFSLSQHQDLFQWVGSWHQVTKVLGSSASASVLPMNVQAWFPLELTGLISLQSKGLSRVFSSTTIQKHQFFGTQPSLRSNSHSHQRRQWQPIRVLAWRIPGTGEPGGLPSVGSHRVGHDWSDAAAAISVKEFRTMYGKMQESGSLKSFLSYAP